MSGVLPVQEGVDGALALRARVELRGDPDGGALREHGAGEVERSLARATDRRAVGLALDGVAAAVAGGGGAFHGRSVLLSWRESLVWPARGALWRASRAPDARASRGDGDLRVRGRGAARARGRRDPARQARQVLGRTEGEEGAVHAVAAQL